MNYKILPSLTNHNWNENILNPIILILEVYKNEISDENIPFFFLLIEKKEIKSEYENYGFDTLTISYKVFNSYGLKGQGQFNCSSSNLI